MEIKLLDVSLVLPFDLADPDDAERLEAHVDTLMEGLMGIEAKKGIRQSQVIREEIAFEREWLDRLFGEGSGERVFAGRGDMRTVYLVSHVMRNLNRLYLPELLSSSVKELLEQYSPVRAKRKGK